MPVKAKATLLLNDLREGLKQAREDLREDVKELGQLAGLGKAIREGIGGIGGIISSGKMGVVSESVGGLAKRAATPAFLEEKVEAATRVGQTMALLFMPIVVIVSLVLIVTMNQMMSDVFGGWSPSDSQIPIFGFFITALTLGMLILAGWTWFQFVRTAGFGMFAVED